MEKIYGYKEKDVKGLAEFIKSRKNGTLSGAFSEYAIKAGKAQGTVRNLYYAVAKKSIVDDEFCQKYLDGKPLSVSKIESFDENEERKLVSDILKEKLKGRSVRSVILEMAEGDYKKALRYQNKFRNATRANPELINELTKEIIGGKTCYSEQLNLELNIKKIKTEINVLVDKISDKIKRENEQLKNRVGILEREKAELLEQIDRGVVEKI